MLQRPMPTALLKRSDTYRNGWPAYTLRVKITNYESGKSDEESLYEVSQKGTDKTYVEFMSPRDKGRHLLMLGDDMWIYLPDTSRPVRITPLERLSGDASNGDVARTNYAVDYTAAYVRDEKVGERELLRPRPHREAQRRNLPAHPLLGARRRCTSRARRVLPHLRQAHQIRHLRRIRAVRRQDADLRRLTLYDEIRHNSHSVLDYSNAAPRDLPDKLFYQGRSDRF